jgi:hypothetical protein
LFSGILKGSILAAAQLSLVLYPSVYIANKSSSKYTTFLATYSVLDALLYPVDTIKNILYSETHSGLSNLNNNLELRNIIESTTLGNLYRGLVFKLAFNVPYLTSLYLTTQGDSGATTALSWAVTAALYPLNTFKVRSQLLPTQFSVGKEANASLRSGLYRGVLPFLLLNTFVGWSLRPLFNQEKLEEVRHSVQHEKYEQLRKE